MSKLTLSVDPKVAARAKKYAKQHGVSVSSMVELYLDRVVRAERGQEEDPPILRAVRGILKKNTSREDYRKYLEAKYL